MESWIVIDFGNDSVQKCKSEKEALDVAKEWLNEEFEAAGDIKVYRVLEEYGVSVEVHLVPSEVVAKKKK